MASLIWEPTGVISTIQNLKFRVKMSDGQNMVDSDEGVDFINIVNTQDFSKINLGQSGAFRYSLGLGYIDYNYDDMWVAAEQTYANHSSIPKCFASLGGGVGLTNKDGDDLLPLGHGFFPVTAGAGQVIITAMYWELTNYSCIIEMEVQGEGTAWGDSIEVYRTYDETFMSATGLTYGDASFTENNYDIEDDLIVNYSIPTDEIDGYNILVGFILTINGASGIKDIFPVDRTSVDSAISEGRILWDSWALPYAPAVFNAEGVYDFSVSILNLEKPQFVSETQQEPIRLQLKSQDYNGEIKIYLVDSESITEVNEAIGDDISQWYGEIGEDVIASYGTLDYNGQKIATDNIVAGETKEYEITYTANNVNIGQTDTMSIFIKFDNPDFSAYGDGQLDAENQWQFLQPTSYFDYIDNIEIDIIDVMEEHVEIYNPSDNLITQPADIIHHIFGEELGFDKNNIDTPSKTQSWDQHESFEMAFSVNKEIDSKKLIQEISQSCKSLPVLVNDNLKFITIKNTYTGDEEISTIKADDVFDYSFSRTPIDDIVTKVEVKYNKDYGLDTYLDSHIVEAQKPGYMFNGFSPNGITTDNYYGVKESSITGDINHVDSFLDFECPYIRDSYSAYALAEYLFFWNVNQHNIVDLKLPLSYYALEIGDLIEFDKMMLGKKAYGEKYVLSDEDGMPVRSGQYIFPLFMITETKRDLDSIKIKAIQLHHMSNTAPSYKGRQYGLLYLIEQEQVESQDFVPGSGDFNNDGFTNILDVVRMVNIVVSGNATDDEVLIGDVNQDEQLNVLDVVSIVNGIING